MQPVFYFRPPDKADKIKNKNVAESSTMKMRSKHPYIMNLFNRAAVLKANKDLS